jgi:hypothetical protein
MAPGLLYYVFLQAPFTILKALKRLNWLISSIGMARHAAVLQE